MHTSSAEFRDRLREAVDDEIISSQESTRALKSRRNALALISCLPPETLIVIFSFVFHNVGHLKWLHVTHVCHQWREITLNCPPLWSHIDLTELTLASLAGILNRAKMTPLYLEAKRPAYNVPHFNAVARQLKAHISHTRHLRFSGDIRFVIELLVSSAPILEYLSLSHYTFVDKPAIPNSLFNSYTPRLTVLELNNCDISWRSPLLKGLRTLEIRNSSAEATPTLEEWLDALNEMPQLLSLILWPARLIVPVGDSLISVPQRTVTLPSLTRFHILASTGECELVFVHLVLPALIWLRVNADSRDSTGNDVRQLIPYIAQNIHGSQVTKPLRSILISGEKTRAELLAWDVPDAGAEVHDPATLLRAATSAESARFFFSSTGRNGWRDGTDTAIFDVLLTHLHVDSVSTLSTQNNTRLSKEVWLSNAPRLPSLERVRLVPTAVRAFRKMLAEGAPPNGSRLPLLTKLVLVGVELTALRTYHLRDMLMERVNQGVPLESLDLHTCAVTENAIELLKKIAQDPAKTLTIGRPANRQESFNRGADCTDDDEFDDGPGPWHGENESSSEDNSD